MTQNQNRRAWAWLLGLAIPCGPLLAGCEGSQSTGTVANAPKESPVVSAKDSMQDFMQNRKAQQSNASGRK